MENLEQLICDMLEAARQAYSVKTADGDLHGSKLWEWTPIETMGLPRKYIAGESSIVFTTSYAPRVDFWFGINEEGEVVRVVEKNRYRRITNEIEGVVGYGVKMSQTGLKTLFKSIVERVQKEKSASLLTLSNTRVAQIARAIVTGRVPKPAKRRPQ